MKNLNSIQNEADYQNALDTAYALMQQRIEEGSAEEEKLLQLTTLIEAYESVYHTIGEQTNPVEAIKFRMEQMGLKDRDVAPIFGGIAQVSEYLRRECPLTMKIIYNLHKYLDIPYDLLIEERDSLELDDDAKRELNQMLRRTMRSAS